MWTDNFKRRGAVTEDVSNSRSKEVNCYKTKINASATV